MDRMGEMTFITSNKNSTLRDDSILKNSHCIVEISVGSQSTVESAENGCDSASSSPKRSNVVDPLNRGVPGFLSKLYRILCYEDPTTIEWRDGHIYINDQGALCESVLPKYFRHNRFSSFQRQLNYFGFRKVSRKGKTEHCTYVNESLIGMGREAIMTIHRRCNTTQSDLKKIDATHIEEVSEPESKQNSEESMFHAFPLSSETGKAFEVKQFPYIHREMISLDSSNLFIKPQPTMTDMECTLLAPATIVSSNPLKEHVDFLNHVVVNNMYPWEELLNKATEAFGSPLVAPCQVDNRSCRTDAHDDELLLKHFLSSSRNPMNSLKAKNHSDTIIMARNNSFSEDYFTANEELLSLSPTFSNLEFLF